MEESCLGSAGRGMEVAHAGVGGDCMGEEASCFRLGRAGGQGLSCAPPTCVTPPFKCRGGAKGSCPRNRQKTLHRIAVAVSPRLRTGGGVPSQPYVLKWARNQRGSPGKLLK